MSVNFAPQADFGTALSGGGNAGLGAANTLSTVAGINFNDPKFKATKK
jgi:hypothetical protein